MLMDVGIWDRLAPYERRVIELLRNSKDKRARKLAKKRVCFPISSSLNSMKGLLGRGTGMKGMKSCFIRALEREMEGGRERESKG